MVGHANRADASRSEHPNEQAEVEAIEHRESGEACREPHGSTQRFRGDKMERIVEEGEDEEPERVIDTHSANVLFQFNSILG